jgi:ceramide glucosyltransferase
VVILLIWIGSELSLARLMRWHVSLTAPFAMIARDVLIPVIWVAGLVSDGFEWQGHQMKARREPLEA